MADEKPDYHYVSNYGRTEASIKDGELVVKLDGERILDPARKAEQENRAKGRDWQDTAWVVVGCVIVGGCIAVAAVANVLFAHG